MPAHDAGVKENHMPLFTTVTGLFHGGRHITPGETVELSDDVAGPLIASNALKPSDVTKEVAPAEEPRAHAETRPAQANEDVEVTATKELVADVNDDKGRKQQSSRPHR
jgi:hypothetical protein